ncbi:SET and MYND domain containing, class 5 [Arctopsyche grandis]|uniref:SET and MYND domain containing, class 5 n=1 Tax=Arctopsyche grandis TaxID=121162 RepID=UPI00406D90B0
MSEQFASFEIRLVDHLKGKGLFATRAFREGDVILEELPFISCQFSWNKDYKYLSCDHCMRPLETAEQNVRRLAAEPAIILPHPQCCTTSLQNITQCENCDTKYCSNNCREIAYNLYHRTLCHSSNDTAHPLEQLVEAWKQVHFPPETATIMLIIRILAMIHQSSEPDITCTKLNQFCHRTVNEDAQLVHKLLGDQFIGNLEMLREMAAQVISGTHVNQYLTEKGFSSLMALIGTNGQGIGTSPMAQWVNNVSRLNLPAAEKNKLDLYIDKLYDDIEKEAGSFLNTEGSGIYSLQSICNHSCIPNAEPSFPYGNHCLQLKAVTDIKPGDEILISYLDECMLTRSKHSRQKELASNYLFTCNCARCASESGDPDVTSCEEMSEDGEEIEDMSD